MPDGINTASFFFISYRSPRSFGIKKSIPAFLPDLSGLLTSLTFVNFKFSEKSYVIFFIFPIRLLRSWEII